MQKNGKVVQSMDNIKQVIVVRKDLGMKTGKIAAQASHASIEALEKAKKKNKQIAREWRESGMEKVVLKVNSERELLELFEAAKRELPCALIRDAGRTQVKTGSITCIGIGPAKEEKIDKFTGKLKLL